MKKMKKLLAMGLAMAMTLTMLTACGGKEETAEVPVETATEEVTEVSSEENVEAAEGKFKIGYNYYGTGSYALTTLANNQQFVIDAFGNASQSISDDFQVDKIVQDIENLISSGCDGIVIWLPAENLYEKVIDMCTEAEVAFVFSDKVPATAEIKEALMNNEYFAGAVGPANAEYGTLIAEYALAKGYKSCIINTGAQGDPTDTPRIEAFTEVFEAGGGTIEQIVYVDAYDNIQPYAENALIATPDVDFVYSTGSDYGIGACAAAENQGLDTKVLTSGLDLEALNQLEDGTHMEFVNGDYWISGTLATVLLQNHLEGNAIKDANGNPVWVENIMPFEVSAADYADFKATFMDQSCYSVEEIQAMSGTDFGYEEFMKVIDDYSLANRVAANK